MSFQQRIKFFLVHGLFYSNKVAQQMIDSGLVEVDNQLVKDNCIISSHSEIKVNGKIERKKTECVYLTFYKPKGFESSLNTSIENNLNSFFTQYKNLSIAGRLDKQSEGLLLLSNDGKWVENLCNPKFEKEKEYIVHLDKNPDAAFVEAFKSGVTIGDYRTKTCECHIIQDNVINIVLKEGKNRQIRRMCKALGYQVLNLKRVRIANFYLNDLKEGEICLQ